MGTPLNPSMYQLPTWTLWAPIFPALGHVLMPGPSCVKLSYTSNFGHFSVFGFQSLKGLGFGLLKSAQAPCLPAKLLQCPVTGAQAHPLSQVK